MDENLAGYLLKALDPDEQRAVEAHLREHPEARVSLLRLRRQLDRLAADAADPEPPPDLWVKVLARVAEHQCAALPAAPPVTPAVVAAPSGSWWRRADLLVAAALLVMLGGLGVPLVHHLWAEHHGKVACANNLMQFHQALATYSNMDPDGRYPWIQARPPMHQAGYFVPMLADAKVLPAGISVSCPARGHATPDPHSVDQLEQLRLKNPDQYRDIASRLGGGYAYPLGYQDGNGGAKVVHRGLTRHMDQHTPLLADCGPGQADAASNSANHGKKGQNVLYIGGNVQYCTNRNVGLDRDDIYLNKSGKVEAGEGPRDSVLAPSEARPYPGLGADD